MFTFSLCPSWVCSSDAVSLRLASLGPIYTQSQCLSNTGLYESPASLKCCPPPAMPSSLAATGGASSLLSERATCAREGCGVLCGQGPSLLEWTRWCH